MIGLNSLGHLCKSRTLCSKFGNGSRLRRASKQSYGHLVTMPMMSNGTLLAVSTMVSENLVAVRLFGVLSALTGDIHHSRKGMS